MKKSLDISAAFNHFFQLKDWYMRVLFFGGIPVTGFVLMFLLSLVSLIPYVGTLIYCFGYIIYFTAAILFTLYSLGYKVELADAVAHQKNIGEIKVWDHPEQRIKYGFKLGSAYLLYLLPIIIPCIIIFFLLFLAMFSTAYSGSDCLQTSYMRTGGCLQGYSSSPSFASAGILVMIVMMCVLFVVGMISLFIQYAVFPAMLMRFLQKKSFQDIISLRKNLQFIRDHALNLLLAAALVFAVSMAFAVLMIISELLMLICIGIFLFAALYALFLPFSIHFEAHLYGQIASLDKGT